MVLPCAVRLAARVAVAGLVLAIIEVIIPGYIFAGFAVAAVLVGLKLWALGETGALSVAASLADSAMDLMISLGAMAAIFYAAKPADEDHAFGHTSAEDLAALGQAVFIVISAGVIAWAAVQRLLHPGTVRVQQEDAGMVVMTASILLTLGLVLWQGRVAARTGNKVVAALLTGEADICPSAGFTQVLAAIARGAALKMVGGGANLPGLGGPGAPKLPGLGGLPPGFNPFKKS